MNWSDVPNFPVEDQSYNFDDLQKSALVAVNFEDVLCGLPFPRHRNETLEARLKAELLRDGTCFYARDGGVRCVVVVRDH